MYNTILEMYHNKVQEVNKNVSEHSVIVVSTG